nr:thiamine-phosphate kinase [Smaragdicoccus niigatensis]
MRTVSDTVLRSGATTGRGTDITETVGELGEFALIRRITANLVQPAATLLGPGDDAAVLAAPSGSVVVTTDMLVEGRHFRFDWSDPEHIGRKAIAQNGADIAAMGAEVTGFVIGLGCPSTTPVSVIDGLTKGMAAEAALTGGGIIGGDMVQSDRVVISVTALGDLGGRAPATRSGAKAGQTVAVHGRLGWSAAGLALLDAKVDGFRGFVAAHQAPTPDYASGPAAANAGATAMIDISDGLLADLGHVAAASGVAVDLDSAALADAALIEPAGALGLDPLAWVLTGGEDHALVAVFPDEVMLPVGWRRIGRTAAGAGVTVDGTPWEGSQGWQSFDPKG